MNSNIKLYDTTLRDGAQTEGVSFSVQDKIKIAELLDEVGIHFIEGGWPGANPKDTEFFKIMKKRKLQNSTLVAFGCTRRANNTAENDPVLKNLIAAETQRVGIFCKGWDFHVTEVLKIDLEQNLDLIYDSIKYLKRYVPAVAMGIEHFYDGYKANPEYVMKIVKTALEAGSEYIGTADTNGGCLPHEIGQIITEVKAEYNTDLSIHAHNDCGLALINTMKAAVCGATVLHGTINGLGERCGMADHCVLIPNLKLKMGIDCVSDEQLKKLREVSLVVAQLTNMPISKYTPYIGINAFYHKAGVHMDAMMKNPKAYDHIDPEVVGNKYCTSVSEQSGKANVLFLAEQYGMGVAKDDDRVRGLLEYIKEQEKFGFQYEGAEASQYLLFQKFLKGHKQHIVINTFKFNMMQKAEDGGDALDGQIIPEVEACLTLTINGEKEELAATHIKGPIAALGRAVNEGVQKHYKGITDKIKVTDFKIRVLDFVDNGQEIHKLRVFLELNDLDSGEIFHTVAASHNIYTAFLKAYIDGIEYSIIKAEQK